MRERNLYAEPFRIKMIEPIRQLSRAEREKLIESAGYNVFNLKAEDVYIDLLTDSGTAAMSANQWAGMMLGDESYAGSTGYYNLQRAVQDIFGYGHLVITYQGRAAENILMSLFISEGQKVLGNMHFDTTEGHIRMRGADPVNLVIDLGLDFQADHPFKGNINLEKLEQMLAGSSPDEIPLVILTVTCNSNGGQPVALKNIKAASEITHRHNRPLFLDAARYAENCYFIKERDQHYSNWSISDIAREMFSYADGCTMSAKKDALVNIGGFLAFKERTDWHEKAVQLQIQYEGFRTYGGLAGRDLEALARGLYEGIDETYLEDRIGQVQYLAEKLNQAGIPVIKPAGGHGVFINALEFLPHLPRNKFPAQTLVVELYREAGIRSVELGACAFGYRHPRTGEEVFPKQELVRLAIPRRVYTDRHMLSVVEALKNISAEKESLKGLELIYQAEIMRHFTARFQPASI